MKLHGHACLFAILAANGPPDGHVEGQLGLPPRLCLRNDAIGAEPTVKLAEIPGAASVKETLINSPEPARLVSG